MEIELRARIDSLEAENQLLRELAGDSIDDIQQHALHIAIWAYTHCVYSTSLMPNDILNSFTRIWESKVFQEYRLTTPFSHWKNFFIADVDNWDPTKPDTDT